MTRTVRAALAALGMAGLLGGNLLRAADEPATGIDAKSAFARLKSLAGDWKVAVDEKQHAHDASKETVSYAVKSNGSVVMQNQFPGSDHEMISVYHLDGDDLKMTHYCAIGNQPRLKLDRKASSKDTLVFHFDGGTNLNPDKDMYIAGLTIRFKADGKIEEAWESKAGGKKGQGMTFELTRR
ncbi:MAG: hypothetical protein U0794_10305 [Isosphaeraceae bacterium]